MSEKDPLEELLKRWETPAPRPNLEANILRRLHSQPARESLWQRWFVEPWELWRQQAILATGATVLAVVLGISTFSLPNESSEPRSNSTQASLGLGSLATFPEGTVTTAYWELVKR